MYACGAVLNPSTQDAADFLVLRWQRLRLTLGKHKPLIYLRNRFYLGGSELKVMSAKPFDVTKKRKRITAFPLGKIWVFKYFFGDKDIFRELADYYNRGQYRFEFKTATERDEAFVLLENNGFDIDLVEDPSKYVVKLDKSSRYAPVLKNSVEYTETSNERIFLMKDMVSVEEALNFGAEVYEGAAIF